MTISIQAKHIQEKRKKEGKLSLCTVTKIHFHSVFVNMDEYGRTGLIHISEVSPGRIDSTALLAGR